MPGVQQTAEQHRVEVARVAADPAGEDGVGALGFSRAERGAFREQQRPHERRRAETRVEPQRLLHESAQLRERRRAFETPVPVVLDGQQPRQVGQQAPDSGGERRDPRVAEVRPRRRRGGRRPRPHRGRDPPGHPETHERQAGAGETAGAGAAETGSPRGPHPLLQETGAAGRRARHGNTAIAAATMAAA